MKKKSPLSKRGSKNDTVPGRKPSVALDNELAAKNNLSLKVNILLEYLSGLESGVVTELRKDIPLSPRQFNMWEHEDSKYGKIESNGRLTFLKYSEIVSSATELMEKISYLHTREDNIRPSSENLAAARRSGALQKTMRQICEREMIKLRAVVSKLIKELDTIKAQHTSLEKASTTTIESLRAEIASLQLENQALIKQHRKIVGIGVLK